MTITDASTDTKEPAETTEPTTEPTTDEGGNAEAAKYRRRLREAEAERDAARGTVESLQRQLAEHLVADRLAQPSDLWDIGRAAVTELLGEDGALDPAKVSDAVDSLLAARPGLSTRRAPRPDAGMGKQGGAHDTATSLGGILKAQLGR